MAEISAVFLQSQMFRLLSNNCVSAVFQQIFGHFTANHWNFTLEILTNRKSYTGKYYTGKYTYWKMIHRNCVTQELLYRNLSYTGKTNPEKVRLDN